MFQLNEKEFASLRSQIATSKLKSGRDGRRYTPRMAAPEELANKIAFRGCGKSEQPLKRDNEYPKWWKKVKDLYFVYVHEKGCSNISYNCSNIDYNGL